MSTPNPARRRAGSTSQAARLTARGWGVLASAALCVVIAYTIGWPSLLDVGLILAILPVVGLVQVRMGRERLEVRRGVDPDVAPIGSPITVRLTVTGSGARAGWRDRVPRALDAPDARGHLVRVAGSPVVLDYEVHGLLRGGYQIGPLVVERLDALGLVRRQRSVGGTTGLTVLPRVHAVPPPPSGFGGDIEAAAATVAVGGGQRDVATREYRSGDPMRSVDWRATAHRGELMVRSEAPATSSAAAVVLDVRESAWADEEDFEDGVEYAASLVVAAAERLGAVRVVVGGDGPAEDLPAALRMLGGAALGDSTRPERAVLAAVGRDVHAVHLVTGARGAAGATALPRPGAGWRGSLVVIGEGGDSPAVPAGWVVTHVDPFWFDPDDAAAESGER